MTRSLVNITRDLISARYDVEIWEDPDALALVDDLIKERFTKENGMQYLYGEMEGEIALFTKQTKRMQQYTKFLKNSQERLKSYVLTMYESTGDLPKADVFNPVKISQSSGAVDVTDELVIPMDFIDNLREFLNCGLNKFPQSNELKSILSKLDKEAK